jgi:hypothetical protein
MEAKQATFQTPRPEVKIYSPDSDKPKLEFDTSHKTVLQAYSFKTSVNDEKGQFSLTFYPDDDKPDKEGPIFDRIDELDIVKIYESKNHFKQYYWGSELIKEPMPTFTGVVRRKKYVSQVSGTSVSRRLVISGHSIVGLAAEFRMSMDLSAQVITEELVSQENVAKSLTISLISKNEPRKVSEVVKIIWDEFINLSTRYGKLSNPAIAKYLAKWSGYDFFDIDEKLEFHYPLGCVFNGRSTQGFFDLIDGIIPSPVYEKFAYTERSTGKMKIKIRECPFDAEQWQELGYKENGKQLDCFNIPTKLVKSFDIEQSDEEVYTVFFSYLDGYPVQMEKLIIIQKQEQGSKSAPALVSDDEKYKKYGYRPLFVHFIGYGKDEKTDDDFTEGKLQKMNQRLMNWYGNLELMYNGSLTLSTDLSIDMPQAGEKIAFLGGEFYVVEAEHKWAYKGNPETVLSISRGGVYTLSKETGEEIIQKNDPVQSYTVNDGDRIKGIAKMFYGTESKFQLIVDANSLLFSGRQLSAEGLPTIYGAVPWSPNPGHAADVLSIHPDPDKAVKEVKKTASSKLKFEELKYWGRNKMASGKNGRI